MNKIWNLPTTNINNAGKTDQCIIKNFNTEEISLFLSFFAAALEKGFAFNSQLEMNKLWKIKTK